ncbi:hypothetical protein Q9966_010910 [Columba livia]|nr:hypothetical protein Q9966_010910 [Columba livia]
MPGLMGTYSSENMAGLTIRAKLMKEKEKLNFANLILSLLFVCGIKPACSLATKFQGCTVFSSDIQTSGGGGHWCCQKKDGRSLEYVGCVLGELLLRRNVKVRT